MLPLESPNYSSPEVLIIPKQEVEVKTEKEEVKDKTPDKIMCWQFAQETPAEASQVFSYPSPSMHPGVAALPTSGYAPREDYSLTELYGPIATLVKHGSPTKRKWMEVEVGPLGTLEDSTEPMHKKCKYYDVHDLKDQCAKAMVEKAIEETHKLRQELQLMEWDREINNIMFMVFVLMFQFGSDLLKPAMDMRNETPESEIVEQVRDIVQTYITLYNMDMSQQSVMNQLFKDFERAVKRGAPVSTRERVMW